MRCTACGATVPRGHGACPECGVFARVVVKRTRSRTWILMLLLLAVAVAAATYFLTRKKPVALPVSAVVTPVANDRDAVARLTSSFGVDAACIAVIRKGVDEYLVANRCNGMKLGRWRVDRKTGAVRRATVSVAGPPPSRRP